MAGEQGLEPQLPVPETGVLPLDDSPRMRIFYHLSILFCK